MASSDWPELGSTPLNRPDRPVHTRPAILLDRPLEGYLPHHLDRPLEGYLPPDPSFRPNMSVPMAHSLPHSSLSGKRAKAVAQLSERLDVVIDELSSQGKFVPDRHVRGILLELIQHLPRGVTIRPKDIRTWEDYSKLHGRIVELIKTFCFLSPITSLFELEQAILHAEKKESFEALRIGPLIRHPLVKDYFRPHSDLREIPEITGCKLRKHLSDFLSRSRGQKRTLEDFLEFVCKRESAESINHLCIRISSFPLAISTHFRFRSAEKNLREASQKKMEDEMDDIIQHEVKKMRSKLLTANPLSIEVKEPVQILTDVFQACMQLFQGIQKNRVTNFIQFITSNTRCRNLFMLAFYRGAYGIEKGISLEESFCDNTRQPADELLRRSEEFFRQPPGIVLKTCLQHLIGIPFPVDLAALARVEDLTAKSFDAPTFYSLGNGTFLQFVASQPKAIEALGGQCIVNTMETQLSLKTKQILIRLISQLKEKNKERITEAIKYHYGAKAVTDLGCGRVEKLLSDEKASQQPISVAPVITYLAPLLINGSDSSILTDMVGAVGPLGHQSPQSALECLAKAPLLEDLQEWSHWDLIYKPSLGDLSDFLCKQPAKTIFVLEVSPGRLIRVNPESSHTDFANAVKQHDSIATAGHLVSMAVKSHSVHELPIQLLSKYIESALAKMSELSTGHSNQNSAMNFIFECLQRIPMQLSVHLVKEVFLDPLKIIAGSAAVDELLSLCKTQNQRSLFQSIGIAVGIKAWIADFKAMIKKPGTHSLVEPVEISQALMPKVELNMKQEVVTNYGSASESSLPGLETGTAGTNVKPPTPKELQAKEMACKAIVEAIRHDEFGIGIELNVQQQAFAAKTRLREGRGLQRLSLELYSKDTHFVLELIQNADDNSYPNHLYNTASDEVPSLKFIITSSSITILNNEIGFLEPNIRAVCDVGKSTKEAHHAGYIGQKGIGFKSVFRVSDTPEIHSNGFHIKFDASSDPIGYILPHWITMTSCHEEEKWTTRIHLPLKKDQKASNIAKKFQDIQPSILLFLHRLRNIIVDDQVSGDVRYMTCSKRGNNIVEIEHSDGTDLWLVLKAILTDAKQYKPDVEATELALAFPLPANLDSIPLAKDLDQQYAFAFLPLRSYGFRFIVQGDFELPSSREDINSDSAWNQWLREEIPSLFLSALEAMKKLPGITEKQAVSLFLQFVPLEGEVHNFFKPVSSHILSYLNRAECLPSQPLTSVSNAPCNWKQPSQLLFVKNAFIRQHIPQSMLEYTLQLSYLDTDVLMTVNPALQLQLGMGSMTIKHLLSIVEYTLKEFFTQGSVDCDSDEDEFVEKSSSNFSSHEDFVAWIASWLACVHIVMEESNDLTSATWDKLKQLQIIPLSDGKFEAICEGSLFFPTDYEKGNKGLSYQALYKEMRVVDTTLFKVSDDMVRSRIYKILEVLGVKNLQPADIINYHILPQFISDKWKAKDSRVLCSYLVFIKENIGQPGITETEIIRLFKDCVAIVTKHNGAIQPSKNNLYFSSEYKSDPDLEEIFPGVDWVVVDPLYLKLSKRLTPQSWRLFFTKLGVKTRIAVEKTDQYITKDNPQWNGLHEWKRSPDGSYTIRDYCSMEFEKILKSVVNQPPAVQRERMRKLAELLDKDWNNEYRQYIEADCRDGADENSLGSIPSSFQKSLVQLAWLPSKVQDGTATTCLYQGKDLFADHPLINKLLDRHVPYIGAKLVSGDFVRLLGIKTSVNHLEVLSFLQEWSSFSMKSGSPFTTSIEHMTQVYMYLISHNYEFQVESLNDCFQSNNLIFVPDRVCTNKKEPCAGHFYSIHDVCWMDGTSVIYKKQVQFSDDLPAGIPKLLQPHYRTADNDQIKNAFISNLGVTEKPKVIALITLLKYISSLSATPQAQHIEDFCDVALGIAACQQNETFVYNNLKEARVFPTQESRWVALEDGLFENDDTRIAKLYTGKGIHFLQWSEIAPKGRKKPPKRNPLYQELYQSFVQICQIHKLTQVIHMKVTPVRGITGQCEEFRRKLHYCVPLIQRYLLSFSEEHYKWLSHHFIKEKLDSLQILSVSSLECVYTVQQGGKDIVAVTSSGCEYEDSPPTLYVATAKVNNLVSALKSLFLGKKELYSDEINDFEKFLKDLLLHDPTNTDEAEDFACQWDLGPVPDGEPVWCVCLPETQEAPEDDSTDTEDEDTSDRKEEDEKMSEPQTGLKAWPPKAPVLENDIHEPGKSSKKGPGFVTATRNGSDSDDAIGEAEIKQLKHKHLRELLGEESEQASSGLQQQPISSSQAAQIRAGHMAAPIKYTERSHLQEQQKLDHDTVQHTSTTAKGDMSPDRREQGRSPDNQPQMPQRAVHGTPWKEKVPAHAQDSETVDIRSIMHSVQEEELESVKVPDNNPTALKAIGRWGEEFVFIFLTKKKQLPDGREFQQISWENQKSESGKPYDIVVQVHEENVYIEVKSTASSGKELVALSWKELKFAEKESKNFHLYRVCGAGQRSQQLFWLENLYEHLECTPTRFFLEL